MSERVEHHLSATYSYAQQWLSDLLYLVQTGVRTPDHLQSE